jgi:hypothetical protein
MIWARNGCSQHTYTASSLTAQDETYYSKTLDAFICKSLSYFELTHQETSVWFYTKRLVATVFSMHRVKFVQGQQIPRNRSLSDEERGNDPVSGLLRPS